MKTTRVVARNLLGSRLTDRVQQEFRRTLGFVAYYRSRLRSKRGLEIGGPSTTLAEGGPIPVYDVLTSLDNCLFSERTIWAEEVQAGNSFDYHPGKPAGTQFICEATDLQPIKDSSYDCLLACHCLEHIANPLRALVEWKRVLRDDGLILLILPHKDATFDWRRPLTPLAHMIEDYENSVGEDDLTHLPEILELHDLSRDPGAGSKEEFRLRCLENYANRAMHQHVFDTASATKMMNHMGFKILRVDTLGPLHIIIFASLTDGPIDNRRFMHRWHNSET
ncbi:MAG: methyltransferase domain-containing protein [Candidatus Sulfotelmatobacter sp.]